MFKHKVNRASKAAKQQQQPVNRQDYFHDCHRTYSCIHCRAHLANHDELISKLFQGNHGRAYLFNKVVNIGCKQAVQRELLTGLHAVADIYCDNCETTLGWKYEQAFVPSQKYKEGKYIIELVHMLKENDWDLTSYNARELLEEAYEVAKISQDQEERQTSKIRSKTKALNKSKTRNGIASAENKNGSVERQEEYSRDHLLNQLHQATAQLDTSERIKTNPENERNYLQEDNGAPLHIISENRHHQPNELSAEQINADILSDGIELLELSTNKLQLFMKVNEEEEEDDDGEEDEENNDTTTSSKNSLYSTTRSQSDLSSSNDDLTNKPQTKECSTSGSTLMAAKRSPFEDHKLKDNFPNEINSQKTVFASNKAPEVELSIATGGQ